MKKLMTLTALLTLASCGKSTQLSTLQPLQNYQSRIQKEEMLYVQPQVGIHRVVTIDDSMSAEFNFSINPKLEGKVLGDRAFYVSPSHHMYPEYVEYKLGFYSSTKLKMVKVFNNANPEALNSINLSDVRMLKTNEVNDIYRNDFIWGIKNLDQPDMNMLNKGYLVTTEVKEEHNKKEFTALATYLLWIQCDGKATQVNELAYKCEKYGLKFHYKLLEYKLTEETI